MRRALALTDHQLRLVERAARSLPVGQRDEFFAGRCGAACRHAR